MKDGNASDDEDEELKKDFVDEGEVVQDTKHKIILPSRNLHNKNNNHDKEGSSFLPSFLPSSLPSLFPLFPPPFYLFRLFLSYLHLSYNNYNNNKV